MPKNERSGAVGTPRSEDRACKTVVGNSETKKDFELYGVDIRIILQEVLGRTIRLLYFYLARTHIKGKYYGGRGHRENKSLFFCARQISLFHMKILLGDLNGKVGRELLLSFQNKESKLKVDLGNKR
jgi:hypothetical protein